MEIPIVDFETFLNGNDEQRKQVSDQLINIVKKFGFVYLKNHGIQNEIIDKVFNLSKQFFEKPLEYKMAVKKSYKTFVGYSAILEEKLVHFRPADLKESYMLKQYDTPWPNDWDEFKDFMLSFHKRCYSLSLEVLRSFAIGLNIDQSLFDSKLDNGECALLRLLHYPPLPDTVEKNQIRAGEHTDYGALTILFQDSIGGLEVKTLDDQWIPAPHHPNTVLINIGDCMEMWTNGLLRSTPHRVVNPNDDKKDKSRYSAVFFCEPDTNHLIECIDKFVSQENPAKYSAKYYRDHLLGKYKETYPSMI